MKAILKYQLLCLTGILFCAALSIMSCEDKETLSKEPGTDIKLKAPQDLSSKVLGTTVNFVWRGQPQTVAYNLELSSDAGFTSVEVIPVTSSSLTIEALPVRTEYWVRVKAIAQNTNLDSDYSETLKLITGDENILKATPVELLDTSITIQWLKGAAVTHVIFISTIGEEQQYNISSNEIEVGEKKVTALTPEETYTVVLYNGNNVRGEGIFTMRPLIFPPLEVILSDSTPISFDLEWAADEDVTRFVVNPAPILGGATITLTPADISLGRITISGLAPATTYTIEAFYNNSPRGTNSYTTPALAAITLASANVKSQSVDISWTPTDSYVTQLNFVPTSGVTKNFTIDNVTAAAGILNCTGLDPLINYTVSLQFLMGSETYTRATITVVTLTPPPPRAHYMPSDGSGSLLDTLSDCITGDTVVLAAGKSYALNNYLLKANATLTIMGLKSGIKPILSNDMSNDPSAKQCFSLSDNANLYMENLIIDGSYFGVGKETEFIIAHSATPVNAGTISIKNCEIKGFSHAILRLWDANVITKGLLIDDCIISGNTATDNGIVTAGGGAKIEEVSINNTTIYNWTGYVCYATSGIIESVTVQNTTLNDVFGTNNIGICRNNNGQVNTLVIENVIVGKTKVSNAKIINNVTVTTRSNNYRTSDCPSSNQIPGITLYNKTADNLFQNPAAGDFTIKDMTFAGRNTAGDPRWRP
jgi:hypothetical protein